MQVHLRWTARRAQSAEAAVAVAVAVAQIDCYPVGLRLSCQRDSSWVVMSGCRVVVRSCCSLFDGYFVNIARAKCCKRFEDPTKKLEMFLVKGLQ